MKFKAAAAQIQARYFDKEENQRKVLSIAREAYDRGANLVLFPEGSNLGYFVLDGSRGVEENLALAKGMADTLTSPLVQELKELAGQGMLIGCGCFMKTAAEKLTNGLLLFTPAGDIYAYNKTHLFHTKDAKEADFVDEGDVLSVFDVGPFKAGLSICYDLNFPEVFRTLALKGAQVILICAAWPTVGGGVWDALLPARSIENQAYVIASNQTGGDYYGHSKITDFTGRVLAAMGDEEGCVMAELDLEKQEKWKKIVTYFNDRRPGLYSL